MAKLTYHGHSTFSVETDDGTDLVIDPFFTDNPVCETSVDEVAADFILLTHGHYDHIADVIPLAERTGATVISSFEICQFLESEGLTCSPHSIGGGVQYPFGYAKMTPALHGGKVELPGAEGFPTIPGGWLVNLKSGQRLHHAGDTSLLMDMQLLKGLVDLAILPIGDRFTMGPEDAIRAIEFIEPKAVVPCHYNTWPPIAQDCDAFKAAVGSRAHVEVMKPGASYDF